jgi:hypothetical protein
MSDRKKQNRTTDKEKQTRAIYKNDRQQWLLLNEN